MKNRKFSEYKKGDEPAFLTKCSEAVTACNEFIEQGNLIFPFSFQQYSGTCLVMFKGSVKECEQVKELCKTFDGNNSAGAHAEMVERPDDLFQSNICKMFPTDQDKIEAIFSLITSASALSEYISTHLEFSEATPHQILCYSFLALNFMAMVTDGKKMYGGNFEIPIINEQEQEEVYRKIKIMIEALIKHMADIEEV
jgi:hypothetical protein